MSEEHPQPHKLCRNKLEDFNVRERAENCPFCLKKGVECEGNFHFPGKEQQSTETGKDSFPITSDILRKTERLLTIELIFM